MTSTETEYFQLVSDAVARLAGIRDGLQSEIASLPLGHGRRDYLARGLAQTIDQLRDLAQDQASILQAAVGPDGAWEDWMSLDDAEKAGQADRLTAKNPGRWRIVGA
jgi:hypothetical protein